MNLFNDAMFYSCSSSTCCKAMGLLAAKTESSSEKISTHWKDACLEAFQQNVEICYPPAIRQLRGDGFVRESHINTEKAKKNSRGF